jgi:hypothetical protein
MLRLSESISDPYLDSDRGGDVCVSEDEPGGDIKASMDFDADG